MFNNGMEGVFYGIGVLVLGLILAWGGYSSVQYRKRRGLPLGARPATGPEAAQNAAVGQGREKSTGEYALRLGLPVLAALLLVAIVAWMYI